MTFEEWCSQGDREEYFATPHEKRIAKAAWEARVPEGYVIVPVTPTKEIVVAGADRIDGITFLKDVHEAYKAMIQAAQESE